MVPDSLKDHPWWGTKPHQKNKNVALTEKPSQRWKRNLGEKLAKFSSKSKYNSKIVAATEKSSLRRKNHRCDKNEKCTRTNKKPSKKNDQAKKFSTHMLSLVAKVHINRKSSLRQKNHRCDRKIIAATEKPSQRQKKKCRWNKKGMVLGIGSQGLPPDRAHQAWNTNRFEMHGSLWHHRRNVKRNDAQATQKS